MCLVRSTHAVAVAGQWRRSAAVSTSGTTAGRDGTAAVRYGAAALAAPGSRGKLAAGALAPAADSGAGRVRPWFPAATAAAIPVTATRTATAAVVPSRARDRGIGAFMRLPVPLI